MKHSIRVRQELMDRDTTFRWVCIILNSIRNSPLLKTLKCDYNCSCCCHINVILQSRSNLNWLSHARTDIVPKNLRILDFTSQGSFTELAPSSFCRWSGSVRCHWVQKLAATVFLNFVSGNWLSGSKQDKKAPQNRLIQGSGNHDSTAAVLTLSLPDISSRNNGNSDLIYNR